MLVLLDQPVEQVGISTSKPTSDLGALLRHRILEIEGSRVHTNDRYAGRGKKDASIMKKAATLLNYCSEAD